MQQGLALAHSDIHVSNFNDDRNGDDEEVLQEQAPQNLIKYFQLTSYGCLSTHSRLIMALVTHVYVRLA
jgi:hypothetical protein